MNLATKEWIVTEPTQITKKYEFVEGDEKIVAPGIVVKRIRALVAIPALLWAPAVQPGDLGGYIAAANNLHAQVSGNAWVYDDAQVYGDALVYDDAQVFGNAQVCGNAQVSGNAEILQTWHYLVVGPIGSEGTHATLTRTKGGGHRLSVGCWEDGSLGTLMTEVKRRRLIWSSDEATQKLWMEQYRALLKLGKAVVARWIEAESRPAS